MQSGDGREAQLLQHVLATTSKGDVQAVLDAIDGFAASQSWLMTIGAVKGRILDAALTNVSAKVALELGGYIGYSGLRIARRLPQHGHLYSLEPYAANAEIAEAVLQHAGLGNRVTVLRDSIGGGAIQRLRGLRMQQVDLAFVDHVKELYKEDTEKIIQAGLLRKGTAVVADNIVTPGAPEYRKWMSAHPRFETHEFRTTHEHYSWVPDEVMVSYFKG